MSHCTAYRCGAHQQQLTLSCGEHMCPHYVQHISKWTNTSCIVLLISCWLWKLPCEKSPPPSGPPHLPHLPCPRCSTASWGLPVRVVLPNVRYCGTYLFSLLLFWILHPSSRFQGLGPWRQVTDFVRPNFHRGWRPIVLFLTRIELIVFTVATMGLCFVLNTGLIIQKCFFIAEQGLHRAKAFSVFHTAILARKLEVHGKLGGDTGRTGDPSWWCHITLCSVYKVGGGKKEEGETFEVMAFVFPRQQYVWWGPAPLEMAEHLPAHGKEWLNSLVFFVCARSFCFP